MVGIGLCLATAVCGCLDNDLPPEEQMKSPSAADFIALQKDFADFRDWKYSYQLSGSSPMEHASGEAPVTVYINALPDRGAEKFPKGTLIVKAVQLEDPRDWIIHAMAKRGDDFNVDGALGWEFFELSINSNLDTVMVWRGEHPPKGETYQALPGAKLDTMETDCSGCHVSTTNDAVLDANLDLKDLP